ncbi:Dam family site-specific DNA-(adenine-N6)-methyltransferase [Serratia sp. PAMC26656]|uniref:Dam family site-specific DNA-(adenine-N6)-methyltransferase n=1 Tax=Serratia sp. PAMC26656 TaxID=2775909 RepID=UPI0018F729F6|nr:Dam family site-specific DNA-(adenine-N6)-methyltransferase [Serratia sp. PAMC26656]MBJ7892386.1 Dam family site-specific DNA-(adenine-N6)-methyltransferase [Serratia sp. PAMC26656]
MNKPVLKWLGSKARIIDTLRQHLPEGRRLVEPFVGSGAVFLNTDYDSYLLCDINSDLINFHSVAKNQPEVLIREARHLFNAHPDQEGYYRVRADFNLRCDSNFIYRAAQFLYLNRHTFNGVCRYNLSGEFNSPFGHRKAPYFPENEIRAFAEKAQAKKAIFLCCSFPEAIRMAQAGDVIYCDPPYIPASATASFTSYHTDGFTSEQQRKLARMLRIAAKLGRHVVASNSETDAAKALYADFAITSITARRSVSAKAASRANAGEIIATMRAAS